MTKIGKEEAGSLPGKAIHFHVGHPSQYYIFRALVWQLKEIGIPTLVTYNEKDIVSHLFAEKPFGDEVIRLKTPRSGSGTVRHSLQFAGRVLELWWLMIRRRPAVSVATFVGAILAARAAGARSLVVTEDDYAVIRQSADIGYRFATAVIAPEVCDLGPYSHLKVGYRGSQKMVYLHGASDAPRLQVDGKPVALIRISSLNAHHDKGVSGVSVDLLLRIVSTLEPKWHVQISSEASLPKELAARVARIPLLEMHQMLAGVSLLIGDSQSMCVEAALLGTPSIRISGFTGRINILNVLEEEFGLTRAFKPDKISQILEYIHILSDPTFEPDSYRVRSQRFHAQQDNVGQRMIETILHLMHPGHGTTHR